MATTDAKPVVKKNTAARVYFDLRDGSGVLQTGKTCTVTASRDGAAFATNGWTVTEVAGGVYYAENTTGSNQNVDHIALKVTASGCIDVLMHIYPVEDTDIPVDVQAVNANTTAADRLAKGAALNIPGTVTDVAIGSSTQFECSDITLATADILKGAFVIVESGTMAGKRTKVTAYSLQSGRGRFTVEDMGATLANGVTILVV
jgi:hypothetical protein